MPVCPWSLGRRCIPLLALLASTGCGPEPECSEAPEPRAAIPFASCQELVDLARYRIEQELEQNYRNVPMAKFEYGPVNGGVSSTGAFRRGPNGIVDAVNNASFGDESHLKSDGTRFFLLDQGMLKILELGSGNPQIVEQVALGPKRAFDSGKLFLHGQQLLAIGEQESYETSGHLGYGWPRSVLVRRIDVSIPGQARVLQSWSFDGALVDAKQRAGVVHVVHQQEPRQLPLRGIGYYFKDACAREPHPETGKVELGVHPSEDPLCKEQWAKALKSVRAHNNKVLDSLSAEDFVPGYQLGSDAGVGQAKTPLYACEELLKQPGPQGVELLSTLGFDLSSPDALQSKTGLFGDAQQILLTPSSLYVAAPAGKPRARDLPLGYASLRPKPRHRDARLKQRQDTQESGRCDWTYIDKYDLSKAEPALHQANARIEGKLGGRDVMFDQDGTLRVAATRKAQDDDYVTRLVAREGKLELQDQRSITKAGLDFVLVAQFLGDFAFYAGGREGPGLFLQDFSKPASPPELAVSKLNQDIVHLQALSPGLLLMVGKRQSLMSSPVLSLFDIRTPLATNLIQRLSPLPQTISFDFDPAKVAHSPEHQRIAILFAGNEDTTQGKTDKFSRVLILGVDAQSGFQEITTIDHRQPQPATEHDPIQRMTLIGDTLWIHSLNRLVGHSILTGEKIVSLGL